MDQKDTQVLSDFQENQAKVEPQVYQVLQASLEFQEKTVIQVLQDHKAHLVILEDPDLEEDRVHLVWMVCQEILVLRETQAILDLQVFVEIQVHPVLRVQLDKPDPVAHVDSQDQREMPVTKDNPDKQDQWALWDPPDYLDQKETPDQEDPRVIWVL